jgi:hypothetical protein
MEIPRRSQLHRSISAEGILAGEGCAERTKGVGNRYRTPVCVPREIFIFGTDRGGWRARKDREREVHRLGHGNPLGSDEVIASSRYLGRFFRDRIHNYAPGCSNSMQ